MSRYYTNYPSPFLLYLGIRATLIPCQVLPLLHLLPLVLCDNLGATYFSVNPIRHSCSKHVEIDIHFVWDVANGVLDVRFVSTKDQLVDILTKPLSSLRFSMLKNKLSVLSNPLRLWGMLEISMTTRDLCETCDPCEKNPS